MSTIPVATGSPARASTAVDWLVQRRRGPQTLLAIGIVVLSVSLNVFHFYSTYFGQTEIHAHRSTHLAMMLLIAILLYPLGRRNFADPLTWHFVVDLGMIAVALGSQVYTIVHLSRFVDPGYEATTMDVVVGTLLIIAVLEATRRTVSPGLTLTAIFFLLQTWHADKFFWIFYGPPTSWRVIVESLYGRPEGLYGIPVAIMSGVLIIFIIFSAFLTTTGIGDFFVRLATGVAGRLTGGPAKVSVLSSALLALEVPRTGRRLVRLRAAAIRRRARRDAARSREAAHRGHCAQGQPRPRPGRDREGRSSRRRDPRQLPVEAHHGRAAAEIPLPHPVRGHVALAQDGPAEPDRPHDRRAGHHHRGRGLTSPGAGRHPLTSGPMWRNVVGESHTVSHTVGPPPEESAAPRRGGLRGTGIGVWGTP